MIEVKCFGCRKTVALLVTGSDWTKGTVALCADCNDKSQEKQGGKKPTSRKTASKKSSK